MMPGLRNEAPLNSFPGVWSPSLQQQSREISLFIHCLVARHLANTGDHEWKTAWMTELLKYSHLGFQWSWWPLEYCQTIQAQSLGNGPNGTCPKESLSWILLWFYPRVAGSHYREGIRYHSVTAQRLLMWGGAVPVTSIIVLKLQLIILKRNNPFHFSHFKQL